MYDDRRKEFDGELAAPRPGLPRCGDLTVYEVLHALADPTRLTIVRTLREDVERACGTFPVSVAPSTLTHHFRVLREAGVIPPARGRQPALDHPPSRRPGIPLPQPHRHCAPGRPGLSPPRIGSRPGMSRVAAELPEWRSWHQFRLRRPSSFPPCRSCGSASPSGDAALTSHRDFQRAFERAVRRAELPVAFSHGFSPHPKISYAGAAPTGAASEAEYLEISLTHTRDPEQVRADLDEALPTGLDIVEVVIAGAGSLAEQLEASEWLIALPGVDPADAQQAVDAFLAREEIIVERMTKRGPRSFDCRDAVLRLTVAVRTGAG